MNAGVSRRRFLSGAAALALPLPTLASPSDRYPQRPVHLIVPLPAGGAADISARMLGEQMQRLTRQPVVVENKPGGIFLIGLQSVVRAQPDGYTLIHLNTGMVAAQVTQQRFNLLEQLTPVSLMGTTDGILLVPKNSRFQSVKDLVAFARENPGKLNYGSVGPGSYEHLTVANFARKYGFAATHVPFKGGPDAMVALARGEIDLFTTIMPLYRQFKDTNQIRALALMVDKRSPALPELPTLREQGIALPPMQFFSGIAAPKGTPGAVLAALRQVVAEALQTPELRDKFEGMGTAPMSSTPEAFSKLIASELAWMTNAVQGMDLKLG